MKNSIKNLMKKVMRLIPDRTYLKIVYKLKIHKKLRINNPVTYNEKIQWLKINDRNPKYTNLVDKYEVKKIVENLIGKEYIIPTIGVYEKWDDIDFEKLPDKFVIKCTHDSGGIVICKNKNEFNLKKAKRVIEKGLKNNFYYSLREWPYKNVKPRIIIEPYMEDNNYKELRDYKFFAFSGKVKLMFIATNRQGSGDTYFDFFDRNFEHLDIINGHPMNPNTPDKPINYEKMIELAEILSKNIKHVRVDFYEINGKIYFGELTFYHWSGLMPFVPDCWDEKLGEYIDI